MMSNQYHQVIERAQILPEPLLREVVDFMDFLLQRYKGDVTQPDDLTSDVMSQIAASGGAFDWLHDPLEDGIYSDRDGEPV